MQLWTIGHSNQPLERFLAPLTAHEIATVADVRRFPGSRRHPHFGKDQLAASLEAHGIRYLHLPELGGRRRARPDSRNTAFRDESFRGYADHMETPEFESAIARVLSYEGLITDR